MVGRDRLAHPLLDRRQVVGRQRPGQEEVVVEAVLDGRPDAELRAREQVEDGLGQDVGGAVAHRPELAGRAVVQSSVALPRSGASSRPLVDLDRARRPSCSISSESRNPSSTARTRGSTPAVPPAFAGLEPTRSCVALSGDSRTGSPVAHGWCGFGVRSPGSQPWPGSLWTIPRVACPDRCVWFRPAGTARRQTCMVAAERPPAPATPRWRTARKGIWWATLDSNQ